MEVATGALSAISTAGGGLRGALVSADTQRRGLQTFSSIIGGHSDEGTEHAIMGENGGGFNIYLFWGGGVPGRGTNANPLSRPGNQCKPGSGTLAALICLGHPSNGRVTRSANTPSRAYL